MYLFKTLRWVILVTLLLLVGVSNAVADNSPWISDLKKAKQSYQNSKLDEAITYIKNAISKMPNEEKYAEERSKAKKNLVALYLRNIKNKLWEGEYNKALELSTEVINFSDDTKVLQEVYSDRGMAYSFLKQFNEANDSFTKAINISPDTAELYIGRASLYISMACADWKKACDLNKKLCNEYNQGVSDNICEGKVASQNKSD